VNEYGRMTYNNPSYFKRKAHGARYEYYCKFVCNNLNDRGSTRLLDFGSGDGYFFNCLTKWGLETVDCYAYEPVQSQFSFLVENVKVNDLDVNCLNVLDESGEFDLIVCAEVLEHFEGCDLNEHLACLNKKLRPGGRLLISVPLEVGLPGALKNLLRYVLRQQHEGMSLGIFFKALFDMEIDRQKSGYIPSHIGFSHNRLRSQIEKAEFKILSQNFLPFSFLRGTVNSQIAFECVRKH